MRGRSRSSAQAPRPSAEDIIKECAFHEAGHYTAAMVMAERLKGRIEVRFKSISLFYGKDVWGETVRGLMDAPIFVECADDEDPVTPDVLTVNIGLGGVAAQAYLRLLASNPHPVSRLRGGELLPYAREADALSRTSAVDDLAALKKHLPKLDWSAWPRTLLPGVLEIVRVNWDGLERVAKALLSAPIVSGVQRLTAEEALAEFSSGQPATNLRTTARATDRG